MVVTVSGPVIRPVCFHYSHTVYAEYTHCLCFTFNVFIYKTKTSALARWLMANAVI